MKKVLQSIVLLLGVLMSPIAAYAQDIYADVNGDLEVNIADINAVIDVILSDVNNPSADVNGDGEINIADINAVIDIILGGGVPAYEEHEYVDLGLPSGTLWATCNIGANSPEEYGDYFAWGETEPKETYSWQTYKWCNGTYDSFTKYCTDSNYGTVDNKNVLEPQDDAAFVNWGPEWRMPTEEQIHEFRQYCSSTRAEMNGVKGRLITGPNGNTIFLPGSGEWNSGEDAGDYVGNYWSRTGSGSYYAEGLMTDSGTSSWGYFSDFRYDGHTIRAVRGTSAEFCTEQQSLDLGLVHVGEAKTTVLTLVNNTKAALALTATAEEPFLLMQGNDSASSMTIEVPGESSAVLMVLFNGTVHGQFDGNVNIRKSTSDVDQINIPVHVLAYADASAQQEYVDLGLPSGTLWATCNVGASSPEEDGDHFAWGETEPKEIYSWLTYKWCNGKYTSLTKYCTNSDYGTVDNLLELEPGDDAAFVNMGPSWRMPTREQLDELKYECRRMWTTLNGRDGYLIIGLNGNTLFLPAAGERVGAELNYVDSECCYWSRELTSYDDPVTAYATDFYTLAGSGRHCGYSVRAVRMSLDDVFIEQQGLDLVGVPVGESSTDKLNLVNNTMEPVTITATVDAPFSFKNGEGSASSMTLVVPANSYAQVTVMFTPTTPGQFDGNVTFQSTALNGGLAVIPVHAVAIDGDFMHQAYVDLGLPSGTLWAMKDVGASSPEQSGYEFVWGYTSPVHKGNLSANGNDDEITRFSIDGRRGMYDNIPEPGYELGTGSDAAYVNWGPEWRMPSMEQIVELTYYCTCSMARINGVLVRLVTGLNGNSMILPMDGRYWSRTSLNSSNYVFGMYLGSTNLSWGIFWGPRGGAHMVRPVRNSQN